MWGDAAVQMLRPSQSRARSAWRRFCRNRPAVVGLAVLAAMVLTCLAGWPWSSRVYQVQDLDHRYASPGRDHWLGTDQLGRDYLARMLVGGRLSLTVGVLAAAVAMVIGTAWGSIAAYVGGRIEAAMMRVVDILYGLPYILLVILLMLVLGRSWPVLFLAIGAVSWLTMARVVRGQVLSLKSQPFVDAARALGVPPWRILLLHILPNVIPVVLIYTTLTVPQAILQESFLSFLGIGMPPDYPTWGSLAQAVATINTVHNDWHLVLPPCGALALTLLGLNFIGDGLRDALDPKARR